MNNTRQLLLGGFFVAVLALLGYYTLFLTDFRLFGESHPMVVHFPGAQGLRSGDSVLVAGMRKGRVVELTFDPAAPLDRRITASLILDQALELREGHTIQIEDSTLLGGRQIAIDPGPPDGAPVPTDAMLIGTIRGNAIDKILKRARQGGTGDAVSGELERALRISVEELDYFRREGEEE